MTIYYQGRRAIITDRTLSTQRPHSGRYQIDELGDVRVVRGELPPVRALTGHLAGAAAVGAAIGWPLLQSPVGRLLAAVFALVPALIAAACWRLTPRCYELRAWYRGYEVTLFESSDHIEFGQVQRALQRALERRDDNGLLAAPR